MRKLHCLLVCMLLLISEGLRAQTTMEVSGKITDPTGGPIPNASVRIKSGKTVTGTSADANGAFTIRVRPGSDLVISAIGYETREIRVGSSPTLLITLNTDSKSLSEVVVTGVGLATSKKKLGIAVQSVSADKLPPAPTASIDQALVGKIPGAMISSTSGNPGDPVNIMLPGINTLNGGTKPLIMVDGLQVSGTDINSLDLSNIERVEVVQGAASASLYGAQGANGVIQIFTRRGKRGSPVITYSGSAAINQYINSGHLGKADRHPFLTDANNNIINYSTGLPLQYDAVGDIDSISYTFGGPTRYGIINTQNIADKPYNANLKFYDHFKQVFQTGSTYNNTISISGGGDTSPFFDLKYKLPDGTHPSDHVADFLSINAFNPFYQQEYTTGLDNKIDVVQSIDVTTTTQISYDWRKRIYNEYDTYGQGLSLNPPINLAATQGIANIGGGFDYENYNGDLKVPFVTFGYLLNQTIDIGNWGGIAGGFRSDYSSAFGQGSKAFTFPHINGYILPSAFDFWSNGKLVDILPTFKLRAAYGEAGIQPQPFDRYPTLGQGDIGSQLTYSLPSISKNPNLQVEVSKEFEVGTDCLNKGASWLSVLNGGFTYWHRKSSNVIFPVNTPLSTGASQFISKSSTGTMSTDDWNQVVTLASNSVFSASGGSVAAMTTGNNVSATFKISVRLIQCFKPTDKRLTTDFNQRQVYNNPFYGTPYNITDSLQQSLTGVYVIGSTQVEQYEAYIGPSYEENALMLAEANLRLGNIATGLSYVDAVRDYQGAGVAHVSGVITDLPTAMKELTGESRVALFGRGVSFYNARQWGWIYEITAGGG